MKFALVNGKKTHAKNVVSGTIGRDLWFPDFEVKACVGKYRQYWIYVNDSPNIPDGYEPETEWHSSWKECLFDEFTEVICGNNREHRADILTTKCVIEIQKSRICGFAVQDRIEFYKKLTNTRVIWIVNVFEPWQKGRMKTKLSFDKNGNILDIEWEKKWSWVIDIAKTIDTNLFLDISPKGANMLKVWSYQGKLKGIWVKKTAFFETYLRPYSKIEYQNNADLFLELLRSA